MTMWGKAAEVSYIMCVDKGEILCQHWARPQLSLCAECFIFAKQRDHPGASEILFAFFFLRPHLHNAILTLQHKAADSFFGRLELYKPTY